MTSAQAKRHCSGLADCVGFTFSCAKPGGNCTLVDAARIYAVYFKSISSGNSDKAWWTYLKLPSAVALAIDASLTASHNASPLVMGCHSDSGCRESHTTLPRCAAFLRAPAPQPRPQRRRKHNLPQQAHWHNSATCRYTHQVRGFYSQMVVGASFEAALNGQVVPPKAAAPDLRGEASSGPRQRIYWNNLTSGSATGGTALSNATQFHGQSSMSLSFAPGGKGFVGVTNRGLGNEGLVFERGKPYEGFFFASSASATVLEVSLRDYTASAGTGATLAKQTLRHPGGGKWLRFNFTLVPSASTVCVNMSVADALWSGGSVDCRLPGMHGSGRELGKANITGGRGGLGFALMIPAYTHAMNTDS